MDYHPVSEDGREGDVGSERKGEQREGKGESHGGTMAEWGGDGKVAGSGKREKHRPGGWDR